VPRDPKDSVIRIGCGATLGVLVGLSLIINVVLSPWAVPAWLIVLILTAAIAALAALGYIYGDRLFHFAHRWLRWFQ
jgi:anaerobic C4-dicarboxylate transporter